MQSTSAVIRLRTDAFAAWAAREKLGSEAAQAERIGVSQPTLNRILNGANPPGEKFIGFLLAASGVKFEDIFEVVEIAEAS